MNGGHAGGDRGAQNPAYRQTSHFMLPTMTDPIRLAKHLAAQLACSRNEAESYIEGGWVTVDGEVRTLPQDRVQAGQVVALLPGATLSAPEPITVLFHKPAGLDLAGWDCARLLDLHHGGDPVRRPVVRQHVLRLQLVAPLEAAASGLVVWTQQVPVARVLAAATGVPLEQEWLADLAGPCPPEALSHLNQRVAHGVPVKASRPNENRLRVAVKGWVPGQMAAWCAQAGLLVSGLRRLRLGRIPLRDLPVGTWRYLAPAERF